MSPEIQGTAINPNEAAELQGELRAEQYRQTPEEMYEVFNSLIAQHLFEGNAQITLNKAIGALEKEGIQKDTLSSYWPAIAESYHAAGWQITFRTPYSYLGEDFSPYFLFQTTDKLSGEAEHVTRD
ncbi:MAG: hypothetical protein JWN38_1108 [Candidatus Saccharibacteria bacterium]|nr:hypothetical protein [Candidatus Saccharibacteria bacterium]